MGHPTYSLVSIRKNVLWLKQNFICSDRILAFGIKADSVLGGMVTSVAYLRHVDQEPWRIVAEDASQGSLCLSSVSPGHQDARS